MTDLHVKAAVYLIAIGFVLTIVFGISVFFYFFGACIEPFVAGYVVHIGKPEHVWRGYVIKKETRREVEEVCFELHNLRKLSAAIPQKYAFEVEARLSDKINVSAFLADAQHQNKGEDLATHKVGSVWSRDYCFEMPGTIADSQEIRVTGHAEHRRLIGGIPFPFWLSITPVPSFLVAPTTCYREDGSVDAARPECLVTSKEWESH